MDANEERITRIAEQLLSVVWAAAERFGLCPVCLCAVMFDMVEQAEADGAIEHLGDAPSDGDDDMGGPLTDTVQ